MVQILRQSTAGQEVFIGKFVDSGDGDTAETGLTINNTDIKLWKFGATSMVNKNSGGATHMQDGDYYAVFDATDSDTLGNMVVTVHVSGALYTKTEIVVWSQNAYDAIIAGSDTLNASVTEWNGVALGTTNPLPNAAAGAAGGLPTDSAGKTSFNDVSAATVNAQCDSAIETYGLDHLVSAAVTGTDVADNSIAAKLVSKSATADWDSYDNTTDAAEAIRDNGDSSWTGGGSSPQLLQSTTIATLASQTSFTLTAGSADDDAYNNALAIITDQSTSTQKAVGFISDYTGSSKTVTLLSDPGIFTIATGDTIDIVVGINQKFPSNFADMAVAIGTGWVTVGTNQDKTGYEIFGTKTTLDDLNDIAATAIVSNGAITTLSGAVVNVDTVDTCTTNTDLVSAASIRSEIDSNSTQLAAIVADTNELQTDWADGGRLDTIVDSILTDTGTTLETHLTDIKGGTFSGATDSLEAIRDRGDAAWTTGAGGTPPQLLQSTTIATLASQTSFTLTAGSADDDAYNGAVVVITDQSTSVQKAVGTISDYTGSTKTITLSSDPAIFTMAVGDTVQIIAALGSASSAPTAAQIRTEIDSNSTKLAAIKAKTDQLTFTDTNKIDATIQVAADIKAVVANKLADHVVRRSLASALASSDGDTKAFRSLAGAVSKLVNKTHPDTVDNTKLNIYETDDTTVLGAQTMTKDSSASPVTGLDTD